MADLLIPNPPQVLARVRVQMELVPDVDAVHDQQEPVAQVLGAHEDRARVLREDVLPCLRRRGRGEEARGELEAGRVSPVGQEEGAARRGRAEVCLLEPGVSR